jgi:hypothetical protein
MRRRPLPPPDTVHAVIGMSWRFIADRTRTVMERKGDQRVIIRDRVDLLSDLSLLALSRARVDRS